MDTDNRHGKDINNRQENDFESRLKRVKLVLLAMIRHPWEHGTAAQAFLESGDEEIAILMAHEAVLRQTPDGRLAGIQDMRNITDPCSCGEAVMFAYHKTGDEKYLAAAKRMLEYINNAPGSADRIQYHNEDDPMISCDCMYMVPPFYAAMGEYKEAVRQIDKRIELLWNEKKGAMNHQYDDKRGCLWRDKRWGAATGWPLAAIVRVLGALPQDMAEERKRLMGYLDMMISGLLKYQLPNGLFYDILDEGETSFVETNCAQMAAYSIYRGVAGGFLDGKYIPAAERMRSAANNLVDGMGFVRGVSGVPTFDYPGISPEGQAFYILMEAARRDFIGRYPGGIL